MKHVTTLDGTSLFVKDWGVGRPVFFSHGWPLNADAWDEVMFAVASAGYRAIAHDRRGHGRSDQPSHGHDMDTYADDLAEIIETFDQPGAVLVGHAAGGGEVVRYLARHGTGRVTAAVLVGAVPPLMVRTRGNPGGQPMERFDLLRAAVLADRARFFRDLAVPFYSADRNGASISPSVLDLFWHQAVQAGLRPVHDGIAAFSETDFRADLTGIDIPVLVVHGDDDRIVPIAVSSHLTAQLLPQARLRVHPDAPHGLAGPYQDAFISDLLDYLEEHTP
jgi:non-heme chloroperoxidase